MTWARLTFIGLVTSLAIAAPAAAQTRLAAIIPSPVDHPVSLPTEHRTPHAWRKTVGAWGESFVDQTLRMRGFNEVLEIKGPGDQGIDRLALKYNRSGKLVDMKIVEVKTHRGTRARLSSTSRGQQLSRTWLAEKFKVMRRSGDPRLRQVAREVSQFRRERRLSIESLGELHDVNTRTGRYVRREPLSGKELSSDSIDHFLRRIERSRVSLVSKQWAARSLAHWDQIRSFSEGLWIGGEGTARAQLSSATAFSSAQALRPMAGRSLRRLVRIAGPLGAAAAATMDAHEVYSQVAAYRRGDVSRRAAVTVISRSTSGMAGAAAGAASGATIGTLGGPIAWITVPAGVTVGAIGGYFAASAVAGAVIDRWYGSIDEQVKLATDEWLINTPYSQLADAL